MSSQRPDAALPPLPVEEDAVDNIVRMLLEHAGAPAAETAEACLRRLAPLSVPSDTPLQHVARARGDAPTSEAPAAPLTPASPRAPTGLTPAAALGPSVAEIVARSRASATQAPAVAYAPPPTSSSGAAARALRRPAREETMPAPASVVDALCRRRAATPPTGDPNSMWDDLFETLAGASAKGKTAPGNDESNAFEAAAEAEAEPSPTPEPAGYLQMNGAFARYGEVPSAEHPVLKHDAELPSVHDLAKLVLLVCPELDVVRAEWYRSPKFVEGFDCEVLNGSTPEEMYEQHYAPTQDDFDYAHEMYEEQLNTYRSEMKAFMTTWRLENPDLWALTDAKLKARVATEEKQAAAERAGVSDAEALREHADAIEELQLEEEKKTNELRNYVIEHYDEIAEIGRGAPPEPVAPPETLSQMALRRVPPTHSYRVRYVGLRAQLREFVTALREIATQQDAAQEDGLLKDWLPSTTYRALLKAVEPGTEAVNNIKAWLDESEETRERADAAIAKAEVLAPVAREEDAIAHERVDALVDYVLAAHFGYTGAAPDASPEPWGPPEAAPEWTDVHAYVEERLLPFLTRLVAGTKQLSLERGAAGATGAGTFDQWLNGDAPPTFADDVLAFKQYLEDTKNVPEPRETHIGGSDRWGTKEQLADLRRYLDTMWNAADQAPASQPAKARRDDARLRVRAGASAEDAMR